MESWKIRLDAGVFPTELRSEIPYFLMGYFFGWTVEQVDNTDPEHIERLIILLEQFNKTEASINGMSGMDSAMKGMGR
jgi:hypothetical protein